VAAAARAVVEVVGKQHLPHAQCVIGADHVDIVVQRVHALQVETDGHATLVPRAQHIVGLLHQQVVGGVGLHPGAKRGQGLQGLAPGDDVVADIDRQVVHAGTFPLAQAGQVDTGVGVEAGVVVPDQCLVVQRARAFGNAAGFHHGLAPPPHHAAPAFWHHGGLRDGPALNRPPAAAPPNFTRKSSCLHPARSFSSRPTSGAENACPPPAIRWCARRTWMHWPPMACCSAGTSRSRRRAVPRAPACRPGCT